MPKLNKTTSVVAGYSTLALISADIFYFAVVGPGSTNLLSVLFGWQWLYLLGGCIAVILLAAKRHNRRLVGAACIAGVSLLAVFIPAQLVFSRGLYITGEGGPAGPEFNCLIWDHASTSPITNLNNRGIGLCSAMSIPSFNKFLIDRGYRADQTDSSPGYYVMLAINESIVIGGLVLAGKYYRYRAEA